MIDGVEFYREVVFYAEGIVFLSACAPEGMTGEDVSERANVLRHNGVGSWAIARESFRTGEPNPTPCNTQEGRRHWLLTC